MTTKHDCGKITEDHPIKQWQPLSHVRTLQRPMTKILRLKGSRVAYLHTDCMHFKHALRIFYLLK